MSVRTVEPPAWIAALAVGDTVVLHEGLLSGHSDIIARVVRLTPTQVVVQSPYQQSAEIRFRRSDGNDVQRASGWGIRPKILEATSERVAAIREARHRAQLMEHIRKTSWQAQTTEVLEAVAALLPSPPSPNARAPGPPVAGE